jgi:hypothetical protein
LEFDFKPHVAEVLRHSPPWGVRLGRRHEDVLCRLCYVLALLDAVARTSGPGIWNRLPTDDPPESARTAPAPFDQLPESSSVGDLLDLAGHESVDDLRQLSWLFFDSQQALLTGQAVLNPHFAGSADVGGADADLIVDGCLIELKTVSDAGRISPKAWPWQLLGYVLLDYDNVYELSSVGIYLARHGLLMQWSLEEYFELLGARTCSVAEARVGLRRALSA